MVQPERLSPGPLLSSSAADEQGWLREPHRQRSPGSSRRGDAAPPVAATASDQTCSRPRGAVLMDVQKGLTTLLVMTVVAALAPFISALLARIRLPQVVVFIVGGVLIGPQVLDWADPDTITLLANVGL